MLSPAVPFTTLARWTVPSIPNGQSRIISWLGEDLPLVNSLFDSNSHAVYALAATNGASQSWQAGRGLNSLPAGTVRKLGVYRVRANGAALTLPDHVTGAGGTVDLQYLGGGSPNPNPVPADIWLDTNGEPWLDAEGNYWMATA